ncbi:hypothetical protein HPG69_009533 [Diceros bicornis minor]|uniref:Uncharacterized protein n=1 Tax=Diceros bicornis minor TaxID=77932 RepID=A0A7J7F3F7_DICBM|nr:hypothetical protein HPG69_009533 [Diceros bicornis minor]
MESTDVLKKMDILSMSFAKQRYFRGDSDSDTHGGQENRAFYLDLKLLPVPSHAGLSESRLHQHGTESLDFEENGNEDTNSSDTENKFNRVTSFRCLSAGDTSFHEQLGLEGATSQASNQLSSCNEGGHVTFVNPRYSL